MGRSRRCEPGGIRQLLDLIEEHPDAIAYDWRTRFGLPASAIGSEMDWAEACSLARILLSDQSSWLGAKASGLDRPWPTEIGRASCRERVEVWVGSVSWKKR